ncbi:hypothetical protein Q5Y75_16525 [Ruegeria sp. 2205SS24-7]|uniref:hypothetical protein n=1 Tax=Ruegeria discodermiae TaxID=3064389 RepID=UPI0027412622|nr:hypothetical protein [Ruegeria sp. 2205SS24-7]MDP5218835.1 hypothetical protein [Ruegeria sp. 2205SS24-7]
MTGRDNIFVNAETISLQAPFLRVLEEKFWPALWAPIQEDIEMRPRLKSDDIAKERYDKMMSGVDLVDDFLPDEDDIDVSLGTDGGADGVPIVVVDNSVFDDELDFVFDDPDASTSTLDFDGTDDTDAGAFLLLDRPDTTLNRGANEPVPEPDPLDPGLAEMFALQNDFAI